MRSPKVIGGHDYGDQIAQFSAGNLQLNELSTGACAAIKWFMTRSHTQGSVFVSSAGHTLAAAFEEVN